MDDPLAALPRLLLPWFEVNGRALPWRADREPYHVWLSEVMLQQTRVEAVRGYYERFLRELPDVAFLAQCDDDRLYKLWEGLGYYSRARNLKKAAVVLMERFDGRFPADYDAVLSLPGIGEYTAGAICSIAFDLPTPAVDGNVLRVLSRLRGDERPVQLPEVKADCREALARVYPAQAGKFTQALMELGEIACTPRSPDCANCPCAALCTAHAQGREATLPVRLPPKRRREENLTVFIFSCDGAIALRKRPAQGLLASLWEFPNVTGTLGDDEALEAVRALGLTPREVLRTSEKTHLFTHVQWNMKGYYIEVAEPGGTLQWFTAEMLKKEAALPTAFRQFLI